MNNLKNRLLLLLALSFATLGISAQEYNYGDNYRPYPGPSQTALTPAPKGYSPCFLSHFGRHGSRYLIGQKTYDEPVRILKQAQADGALTPYGEELLSKLIIIAEDVRGRQEELTPLGHQEHQGIATRIYKNFPNLFYAGAHVEAKSSVVIRCILSMSEELQTLKSLEPKLDITCDASHGFMSTINQSNRDMDSIALAKGSVADSLCTSLRKSQFSPNRVFNSIYKDEAYWQRQIADPYHFIEEYLWQISQDIADTELRHTISLDGLFTKDELRAILLIRNAKWYVGYGATPLYNGQMVYRQRNMLRYLVNEADSILSAQLIPDSKAYHTTASMRFAHETGLLPSVCFLNLGGAGKAYTRLEDLDGKWMASDIFPMGANLQLVFYRKDKAKDNKDVLVKAMLNEREVTFDDLKPVTGPYYRWSEVRTFWLEKLSKFTGIK